MLPHERLFHWFKAENEGERQQRFEALFHPGASYDGDASCWNTVADVAKVTAPLRDVRGLLSQGNEDQGVVVVEGRDSSTGKWHRVAWAFVARGGKILKVTATTSSPLLAPGEVQADPA